MTAINKCLFPVAGYGTRFLPATKAIPKEMFPILTKPLLQHGVEEALSAGINNMAIVTGGGKRAIEDHFDNAFELEAQLKNTPNEHYLKDIRNVIEKATFSYVRQKKMLGLGDAISTGKTLIGNEAFAVILPDDLCVNSGDSVLAQMIDLHKDYPDCCIVAVEEVSKEEVGKYGIVEIEAISNIAKNMQNFAFKITNMIEKPTQKESPSNLAIIGRYILTPDIFDILEKTNPDNNGEIQITDALLTLAKKGKVIAYKFKGTRFDCGSVKGFVVATNYFAKAEGLI
jgi:UTP--glucose-1-phosphate uridylyltransferase